MPEEHVSDWRLNQFRISECACLPAGRDCGFNLSNFALRNVRLTEENMPKLTHFDKKGRAKMVDVSKKAETLREAVVRGSVFMNPRTFEKIMTGDVAKGDVFSVAKVAGIMAAKRTSEIIPMCHPLNLSHVEINFFSFEGESRIDIEAKVRIKAQTGVEMEGFVAVAAASLTIYDMCKAIDRGMVISDIHLVTKKGGKSGTFTVRSKK
ncbi:MAG: cyclic pyranopterin monophosphate synthase MoaC [Thermodesulfobacteriota bacterium]